MKKVLITLIIFLVAVPIILGGVLGYAWYNTDESSLPRATLQANGKTVQPNGYTWNIPLYGGLMYKELSQGTSLEAQNVGSVGEPELEVLFPEGYDSRVTVQVGGATVWAGNETEWKSYVFTDNGDYLVEVISERASSGASAYGSYVFRFSFSVNLEPGLRQSAQTVQQGDVLAIEMYNLTADLQPIAASELGSITFAETTPGRSVAYVPISYNRDPGDYTVQVTAGWFSEEVSFRVTTFAFDEQDLFMDNSDPVISEANSPAAYQQYRDKIYPIFEITSDEYYWEGYFIHPVENSSISTHYGLFRTTTYADGSTSTSRHAGTDYSAEEGTPVYAPNNGRVVFAESLLNTGNTLVIDHGGGLKTYYFHLSEISVGEGDTVVKGGLVGAVGSTGYSTGPHLHYEARIGNQSINPELLMQDTAGLYAFFD